MTDRRLVVALDQSAFDPTSGAARAMRGSAEVLAGVGWSVRFLSTTATEGPVPSDHDAYLRSLGLAPQPRSVASDAGTWTVLDASHRGVGHTLLDVGRSLTSQQTFAHEQMLESLFEQELEHFGPSLVYTFGGSPAHMMMRFRARRRGVPVAVALHNLAHRNPAAFADADAVASCSPFVERVYRESLGLKSTVLPFPLRHEDIVVRTHGARDVTFVNPSREKGAMLVATLFGMLGRDRPDIPLRVVVGRTPIEMLIAAARAKGYDLENHPRLTVEGPVGTPADVLRTTRVLIVPSVWVEPGGMVAGEAVVSGIPVLCSGRGGTAGTAGEGGEVLPLPETLGVATREAVTEDAAQPWFDAVVRCFDDEAHYTARVSAARVAGERFSPEAIRSAHEEFFGGVRLCVGGWHPQGAGMSVPIKATPRRESRSILIMVDQPLFDPMSGAVRSTRAIGDLLRGAGWDVCAIGPPSPVDQAASFSYVAVPAGDDNAYDEALGRLHRESLPDVVLTFGGSPAMIERRARMRAEGAAVVLSVRNHGCHGAGNFAHIDEVITPSAFLSGAYLHTSGVRSTPLAPLIDAADIAGLDAAAPGVERFVTFVNPAPEKGLALIVRIIEGLRETGVPVLVVEGRSGERELLAGARAMGVDPSAWSHVRFSSPVRTMRAVYERSLAVVVPSVWHEPAGCVAIEAVRSGIPTLVSGRGGLAESAAGGAFVIGLPDAYVVNGAYVPTAADAAPWLKILHRLVSDKVYHDLAAHRARVAALVYEDGALLERYLNYFASVK